MKVNLLKDVINYPNNLYILLTPRKEDNKRAFEQILYPEKKQPPFSNQIKNRIRVVSELKNSIERVYIKNEDYFTKLRELNSNYSSNSFERNIYMKKRTLLRKKTVNPTSLYDNIQKRNSYYLDRSKKKRITKSRNYNNPLLKQNFAKTQIESFNIKNNISSYREGNNILLKKFKQYLVNKNHNKNILSRNHFLISPNLTDMNAKTNTSRNDTIMKKAISSGTLSEKNIKFYKNQNNEKYYLSGINPINRIKSDKNNLKNLRPYPSNITFTNYIRDYTDKKNENNNFYTPTKGNNSKDLILNLNRDNNNSSSSKTNAYNNYNYIFSEETKSFNQNDLNPGKNNISSSIIRINKLNSLNKDNVKNLDNLKKAANNFKNFINNKMKNLNNMTHSCNKVLIDLIDKNNQEINISKGKIMKTNETLAEELDIRKDIISEENQKKLKENKTYRIIQEKDYQVKSFYLLKKNLNIISDFDAMKMLEKCLDKSQKEKLDINKLLKERINKKLEKECMNFDETKKKVEKNYKKIIKMRYNL